MILIRTEFNCKEENAKINQSSVHSWRFSGTRQKFTDYAQRVSHQALAFSSLQLYSIRIKIILKTNFTISSLKESR